MKKLLCVMMALLCCGCASDDFTQLGFSETQNDILNDYTSLDEMENECPYPETVKKLLDEDSSEKDLVLYCHIKHSEGKKKVIADLRKQDLSEEQILELLSLSYYRNDNTDRYVKQLKKTNNAKQAVKLVNMNQDIPYYTHIKEITDTDDMLQLVNKYSKLPDDFAPDDLVETPSVCTVGEDYSCFPSTQYVRKTVAEHFEAFVAAAKKEGFTLKSIASLRDIDYQRMLYNYYKDLNGEEYAETYFARPGQSEHNSALAIDVTFDNMNYETIEESEHYQWFLDHMADFGFILRYPKGKEDITGFGHESWHIRYVGKKHAKIIMEKGITLEEYLATYDES